MAQENSGDMKYDTTITYMPSDIINTTNSSITKENTKTSFDEQTITKQETTMLITKLTSLKETMATRPSSKVESNNTTLTNKIETTSSAETTNNRNTENTSEKPHNKKGKKLF